METRKGILERQSLPLFSPLEKWFGNAGLVGKQPAKKLPMISIIIPAHNEAAYLSKTLETLKCQRYAKFETIVVCNGCTDNTAGVARSCCTLLIDDPQKGLSRARNNGARAAKGDLLIFLDADTLLAPDALRIVVRKFTERHAAGTLKGLPDNRRGIYHVLYFFKNWMHRSRVHKGSVGIILCWKEHFEAVGGFDETMHVMENSELIKRLCQYGRYCFIGATPAITSMRRYELSGPLQTVTLWLKLWIRNLIRGVRHQQYETVR